MINQNWIFPQNCGLNFQGGAPTPFTWTPNTIGAPAREGCASISDSSGNLLFYTDGVSIWEPTSPTTHTQRFTGLRGDPSSTQSAIIVPDPGNPNRYYIFTADGASGGAPYNHFDGVRVNINDLSTPTPIFRLGRCLIFIHQFYK